MSEEEESYETVSHVEMREIENEVAHYSPHDLKILKTRTKNKLKSIKDELDEYEESIFYLERNIKKTESELSSLKCDFISEKADAECKKDEHKLTVRKKLLIEEAEEKDDQVPLKTKYIVEKCVPYLLKHANKSENITINSFDDMISDEIIEKTHKLHLDRLFQQYKSCHRYSKTIKWYQKYINSGYYSASSNSRLVIIFNHNTDSYDQDQYYGINMSEKECLKYGRFNVDFVLKDIRRIN